MSHRRRCIGALLTVLIAASAAGCAGGPPPSCGEFTLDQGESIPQEAVDCMSEGGEDRALKVTVASVEGDPIVTTYATAVEGGFVLNTDYGGGTTILLCPDAVSVIDLGECEELHQGH